MDLTNEVLMPSSDYKAACDAIRAKTGEENLIKSGELVGQVDKVYNKGIEAGKKSEWDAFWEEYQQNGRRTQYSYAFAGTGWTDQMFKPKYPIQPIQAYMMFARTRMTQVTEEMVDFSKTTDLQYCFYANSYLEKIEINISSLRKMQDSFSSSQIKTIKISGLSPLCEFSSSAFKTQYLKNLSISGTIGKNMQLSEPKELTKESILSVITALSSESTSQTLTLSLSAVNNAFETSPGAADGSTSEEWLTLVNTKPNWTISLV